VFPTPRTLFCVLVQLRKLATVHFQLRFHLLIGLPSTLGSGQLDFHAMSDALPPARVPPPFFSAEKVPRFGFLSFFLFLSSVVFFSAYVPPRIFPPTSPPTILCWSAACFAPAMSVFLCQSHLMLVFFLQVASTRFAQATNSMPLPVLSAFTAWLFLRP